MIKGFSMDLIVRATLVNTFEPNKQFSSKSIRFTLCKMFDDGWGNYYSFSQKTFILQGFLQLKEYRKDFKKYYIYLRNLYYKIHLEHNSGNKTLEDEFYIKQLFCCVIVHNFCIEDKNRLINLVSTYTYIFYCND